MGKIVAAAAMSHVLDPEYYQEVCGMSGRRKVEACMAAIKQIGDHFVARRPDALIVVADDHMNAFSFNAVPAMCVRIGKHVDRMVQDEPETFDRALEKLPVRFPLHEALALKILADGMTAGFDLAMSWEAPIDHAFLSPVTVMYGAAPITPLVPIWVNAFVAPQPTPARCFALGQHIARVVERSPWNVGIIGTGGLSHFPELLLPRVGEADTVMDEKILKCLEEGDHEPLTALTPAELHKSGEHEFLNWMVTLGAVWPAKADTRYFAELGRINMAAVEWRMA
jgi:2,3-dihydroxyphenylpropionate 1,2-dioxygenase